MFDSTGAHLYIPAPPQMLSSAAASVQSATTKRHLETLSHPNSYVQLMPSNSHDLPSRPRSSSSSSFSSSPRRAAPPPSPRIPTEQLKLVYTAASPLEQLALSLDLSAQVTQRRAEDEAPPTKRSATAGTQTQVRAEGERTVDRGRERVMCSSPRDEMTAEVRDAVLSHMSKSIEFAQSLQRDGARIQEAVSPERNRDSGDPVVVVKAEVLLPPNATEGSAPSRGAAVAAASPRERPSSCFASTSTRFSSKAQTTPPVGHYTARYTIVEGSARAAALRDSRTLGRDGDTSAGHQPQPLAGSQASGGAGPATNVVPSAVLEATSAASLHDGPGSPVGDGAGSSYPAGGAGASSRERARAKLLAAENSVTSPRGTSAFTSHVPQLFFHSLYLKQHRTAGDFGTHRSQFGATRPATAASRAPPAGDAAGDGDEDTIDEAGEAAAGGNNQRMSTATAGDYLPPHMRGANGIVFNESLLSTSPRVQSARFVRMQGRDGRTFSTRSSAPPDAITYLQSTSTLGESPAGYQDFSCKTPRQPIVDPSRASTNNTVDNIADIHQVHHHVVGKRVVSVPNFPAQSSRSAPGSASSASQGRDRKIPATVSVDLVEDRRALDRAVVRAPVVPSFAKSRARSPQRAAAHAAATSSSKNDNHYQQHSLNTTLDVKSIPAGLPFAKPPVVSFEMSSSHHDHLSFANAIVRREASGAVAATDMGAPNIDAVRPRVVRDVELRNMQPHVHAVPRAVVDAMNRPDLENTDSPLRHPRVTGDPHMHRAASREQRAKVGGTAAVAPCGADEWYDVDAALQRKVLSTPNFVAQVARGTAKGARLAVAMVNADDVPGPGSYPPMSSA